jgi:hypothetical protein
LKKGKDLGFRFHLLCASSAPEMALFELLTFMGKAMSLCYFAFGCCYEKSPRLLLCQRIIDEIWDFSRRARVSSVFALYF